MDEDEEFPKYNARVFFVRPLLLRRSRRSEGARKKVPNMPPNRVLVGWCLEMSSSDDATELEDEFELDGARGRVVRRSPPCRSEAYRPDVFLSEAPWRSLFRVRSEESAAVGGAGGYSAYEDDEGIG